jgi:hypothetical protein
MLLSFLSSPALAMNKDSTCKVSEGKEAFDLLAQKEIENSSQMVVDSLGKQDSKVSKEATTE